jgi:putative addiction module component (TIGR02574 family)
MEHWKDQLGGLPESERLELVLFLLQTLEPEDEGASAAWQAEVSRRADEVRSRRAKGRPAEEVFRTMRERYP